MLYRGNKKLSLLLEDGKPYSLYKGDKIIAGTMKKEVKGKSIGIKEPYNAKLPKVEIEGKGSQQKLEGYNLLDKSKSTNEGISTEQPCQGWATVCFDNAYIRETFKADTEYTLRFTAECVDTYLDQPGYQNYAGNVGFLFYSSGVAKIEVLDFYQYMKKGEVITRTIAFTLTQDQIDNSNILFYTNRFVDDQNRGYYATIRFTGMQLVYGSYNENNFPAYEPYCGGIPAPNPNYPIEPEFIEQDKLIVKGKNLIPPKKHVNITSFGITITELDKGTYELNGTCTNSYNFIDNFVLEHSGRYTLSANNNQNSHISEAILQVINQDYTEYISVPDNKTNISATGYLTAGVKMLRIRIQEGITYNHYIVKPQLEEGETATAYEPYVEPTITDIPVLRAIPNTDIRDTYNASTGELTRRVGEVVLTGNEYWQNFKEQTALNQFYFDFKGYLGYYEKISTTSNIARGHFINSRSSMFNTVYTYSSGFALNIHPSIAFDVPEWKRVLRDMNTKGNPAKIWYQLKEPKVEHYNPQEIKQHIGYTHLETIKDSEISATVYTEVK